MESRSRAFHAFPPAETAARTRTTLMPMWAVPLHTLPGLTRLGNVAAPPCSPRPRLHLPTPRRGSECGAVQWVWRASRGFPTWFLGR